MPLFQVSSATAVIVSPADGDGRTSRLSATGGIWDSSRSSWTEAYQSSHSTFRTL